MKKNGFTLIELIAVIVILSLVLSLSIPSLIGVLKNNKEKSLEKINELIISAAKDYVIDYNLKTPRNISMSELCKNYLECPITNPVTNEELIFSVSVDSNKNYTIDNSSLIELKVVLNGGTLTKDISGGYISNSEVTLENPIRNSYGFSGWEVISGDAVIEGDILKLGTKNSVISANWVGTPINLSIDLDGGTSNKAFNSVYYSKNILDLGIPTKDNNTFVGWKIVSGDAVISGNSLIFGYEDVSVKAMWEFAGLNVSYAYLSKNYSCGGTSVGTPVFTYTGTCEIIDDSSVLLDAWRVKLKSSGTLTFNGLILIDVFIVGGGGGGYQGAYAGGGAGGYTKTYNGLLMYSQTNYSVVIGSGGSVNNNGSKSYFISDQYSANGGSKGLANSASTSGGSGGGNYQNSGYSYGTSGQGTTTCEFGEGSTSSCIRGDTFAYSGGGGGNGSSSAKGGTGGGGNGYDVGSSINATANTGGGGGGGYSGAGTGGSGIVVIRNAR